MICVTVPLDPAVVLFYTRVACLTGKSLEEVLQGNIEKLKKRYPQGFDTVRSVERTEGE